MSMLATPLRSRDRTTDELPSPDRRIRPRRGLPGGRAVTGGLLVALAAVGVFAAIARSNQPPSTRYVVAGRDLAVGETIQRSDLRSVALSLPADQADRAFPIAAVPTGRVVLAPMGRDDLVQSSMVGSAGVNLATVTLSLDRADGLGGSLRRGDRVDVYVSYGNGTDSSTRRIAAAAEVVDLGAGSGAVGESGHIQVTLAAPDPGRRIDLVNAAHAGVVTLARVTGTAKVPVARAGRAGTHDVFVEVERNNETSVRDPDPKATTTTKPKR